MSLLLDKGFWLLLGFFIFTYRLSDTEGNPIMKRSVPAYKGMKYEGAKNEKGEYHGSGTLIDSLGFIYQGEFINGKLNVQGTLTVDENYPDPYSLYSRYPEGNYLLGAKLYYPERNGSNHYGNKYVGEFKDGLMHGQGTSTSPDGKEYIGEFKNGFFNGKGAFSSTEGKFIGEFRDGEPYNGKGTYIYYSVKFITNYDLRVKPFTDICSYDTDWTQSMEYYKIKTKLSDWTTISNGRKYKGEIINGEWEGYSVQIYGGEGYEGYFTNGKRNGLGIELGCFADNEEEKYIGEWKGMRKHGVGFLLGKFNKIIEAGSWFNDDFNQSMDPSQVSAILKNKYPLFKGINNDDIYLEPISNNFSQTNSIIELPPPTENPIHIAVVDFNGNNISSGEVIALSDRLRIELVRTKQFKVIEREMMKEILEEQAFQQSGCTTDECLVQIGRLIGVDKILGGNISKVGNIFSVTSRIVNVETGEIEKTEVYDHSGNIGQLLTNGMKQVAIELAK